MKSVWVSLMLGVLLVTGCGPKQLEIRTTKPVPRTAKSVEISPEEKRGELPTLRPIRDVHRIVPMEKSKGSNPK